VRVRYQPLATGEPPGALAATSAGSTSAGSTPDR
jgi:hypothetical protein